ncbi:hypothetical protein VPHK567_0378 [Vibrio phage K567]|nr:hypothetical protein MYOV011v1_p0247 [Vibrio phage 6E35.1a]
MKYISVWCEYDINGTFGGNNNEEIFTVDESLSNDEIESKVAAYIADVTGESLEDVDGLFDWKNIGVTELK